MRVLTRGFLATALVAALGSSGTAQATAAPAPPGSELTVYLMTMGQGDLVWEKYGHNAIGIRNSRTGSDIVYNWGLFSFEEPGFIGRFLRGENMYWMGGSDAAGQLAYYRSLNRTVTVQELNMSPPQRVALLEFIQNNAREENKYYRYDYFLDNCSTRVRDALDAILGGAIRMATDTLSTGTTYRWHAKRLMADDRLTTFGVDIGLGHPTDRPITAWQEMFIPMKVRDYLRNIRVPDDSGRPSPLVTSERVLYEAQRAPERERPPSTAPVLGLIGLALAAGLVALQRRQSRAAMPLAVVIATLLGILGTVLLYLWFLTQQWATRPNWNVLVYNALWLVVVVMLPFAARRAQVRLGVHRLVQVVGALTLLGIVAPFLPGVSQGSFAVIALAAPIGLAAAYVIRERTRPDIAVAA